MTDILYQVLVCERVIHLACEYSRRPGAMNGGCICMLVIHKIESNVDRKAWRRLEQIVLACLLLCCCVYFSDNFINCDILIISGYVTNDFYLYLYSVPMQH